MSDSSLAPILSAPQQVPRPLPLFLDMLRSETAASPERRRAALAGLRAYQEAPRRHVPERPGPVAAAGRVRLIDYGGSGRPVVFVPSLINPPFVLDLGGGRSLVRWVAARGFRALLVDWGMPSPEERDEDLAAHVAERLVPLLRGLDAPPALVGYCLGGTMAAAAAGLAPAAGLAMIAAPWRFSGFGPAALGAILALWEGAKPACERLGLVPMEVLQTGFWRLDPARTIRKFERFGTLDPDSDAARAFVLLEDWANGGAPLTYAAGRAMFEDLFRDDLPGRGLWRVDGRTADPLALACPTVEFVSTSDRIVPAASAAGLADQRRIDAGHVGMVVGSGAREQLWEPLLRWLKSLPPVT